MMRLGTTALVLLAVCLPFSGESVARNGDQLPEAAMQNPALRAHFRQVAMEARSYILPDGRRVYRRDFFLEERVDRLVRGFLRELVERRSELEEAGQVSRLARDRAARQISSREARMVLQGSLRELAKRAGRLRSLLKPVLSDFGSRSDYRPQVEGNFASTGFEAEFEFLLKEIEGVGDLIDSSFLQPSPTVDARTLENGNMLVRLHRVKALAEAVAERLP